MANGGWYGTREEWDRIEGPLLELDPLIDDFARTANLAVTKNLKDLPERSLQWGKDIRCLIQVYLEDQTALTWNIWICCSNDRDGKRYWKTEFLVKQKTCRDFQDRLPSLLEEGRARLVEWSRHPEALELATTLSSP
jgi:hypothetical protein